MSETHTRMHAWMHDCTLAWRNHPRDLWTNSLQPLPMHEHVHTCMFPFHLYIHKHKHVPSHTMQESYVTLYWRNGCLRKLRLMMHSPCLLLWNKPWIITSSLDLTLCQLDSERADIHRLNLLFFSYWASWKKSQDQNTFFVLCIKTIYLLCYSLQGFIKKINK